MLKFSMENTLLTFQDKYYECGIQEDPMEWCLTIGWYDSTWLANIVAAYILEKASSHSEDTVYVDVFIASMAKLWYAEVATVRTSNNG